jgi:hypothetical protein
MVSVDAIYAEVVREIPAYLQAAAAELPRWIRVSERPSGWSDYATLPPVVDLPGFAAAPFEVSAPLLEAARRAHVSAGFVGLALDRVADGQAHDASQLPAIVDALRQQWVEALSVVIGDAAEARTRVTTGTAALHHAAALERAAWTRAAIGVDEYVHLIDQKTAWFRIAAVALLERVAPRAVSGFDQVAQLLMRSLQTFDDAEDEGEDRAARGVSVADALGVTSGTLVAASALLADAGEGRVREEGFFTLAAWFRERAADVRTVRIPSLQCLDAVAALALAEAPL